MKEFSEVSKTKCQCVVRRVKVRVLTSFSRKLVLEDNWKIDSLDLAKLCKARSEEEHFFSVPNCRQKSVSYWQSFTDSLPILGDRKNWNSGALQFMDFPDFKEILLHRYDMTDMSLM